MTMKGESKEVQDTVIATLMQAGYNVQPIKPIITISYLDNATMKREKSSIR